MVERGGESAVTGQALLRQVKRLFKLWHRTRSGELSRERLAALMRPVRRKVKALLQAGARSGHKKTRRTCANIIKVERCLWTFVRVTGIEPTNNAAERALRRAVLWRRKSFGTGKRRGQPVRRADIDGGEYAQAARTRGAGISGAGLRRILPN